MEYFLSLAVVLLVYMTFWFLISLIKKRNDVADVAWGLGFILLAWTSFFVSDDASVRGLVAGILVTIWGLRLSFHIYMRNKGKTEDYRYLAWRKEWGKWFFLRSYFQVYVLQGIFLFMIVSPVLVINKDMGNDLSFLDFAGILIWLTGFLFESIGDMQLTRFIKNPGNKGKLLKTGLWQYTRHPNYFGEVLGWWGIWIISLSVPGGIYAIIGPLTISFLILKVSGIPMLEKKMAENPEFEAYKRETSMFIPLPKRRL